ncbi:hypothetical protein sos41_17640 [Alphaproteobacteria bacterium SO-S41]|nr:hypothetical protein sos41_17640 [Alphaproteobacteria bacterium SO-S41]
MKNVFGLTAVLGLALSLTACGGAGDHCNSFKNVEATNDAVQAGIAAGIASGKIKPEEVAKKIADATPAGAKVPGGDIKKACEFYVGLAGDYGIELPKPE